MEVILLETFDRLGKIGDVVKVKDGFARNFLIPQKKALRANETNKDYFARIKSDLLKKSKKAVDEANLVLKKIENKDIIFIRNASDNGQLYGSVSPKDISNYSRNHMLQNWMRPPLRNMELIYATLTNEIREYLQNNVSSKFIAQKLENKINNIIKNEANI